MNKFTKIFLLIFIAMIFVFSLTSVVFGDAGVSKNIACDKYTYPWCSAQDEGLGGDKGLINTIYKYSLVLVGVVALGAIIYGGILYIISAGNPSGQTEATGWITGAIWGLILLLSAALLFNTINPQIVSLNLPEMTLKKVDIKTPASNIVGCCLYNQYDKTGLFTTHNLCYNLKSSSCTSSNTSLKNFSFTPNYSCSTEGSFLDIPLNTVPTCVAK